MTKTYTTAQARARLGVSISTFHRHRRRYPTAFIVTEKGTRGKGHHTRYDAAAIDHLRKFLTVKNRTFGGYTVS